jgi:hypothetical protein
MSCTEIPCLRQSVLETALSILESSVGFPVTPLFEDGEGKPRFTIQERNKAMAVEKVNSSSSLAEVVDRILDKGIVVDAWVRVSLVGIELLSIEARVVIASVETYLKYAEAVGLTAQAAVPAA